MKKDLFWIVAALLVLAAGAAAAQRLPPGNQAVILKNGDVLTGRIVDVILPPLDLKLENGTLIALRDVWMINFESGDWNYPEERNILETNDHYVFLKSGDIHSGRISAYSADQKAFVFETGESFPLVQCRRIYFSKTVPRGLR